MLAFITIFISIIALLFSAAACLFSKGSNTISSHANDLSEKAMFSASQKDVKGKVEPVIQILHNLKGKFEKAKHNGMDDSFEQLRHSLKMAIDKCSFDLAGADELEVWSIKSTRLPKDSNDKLFKRQTAEHTDEMQKRINFLKKWYKDHGYLELFGTEL